MDKNISRAIIGAGACVGCGLALQPLYAEPGLHQLAVQTGELLLRAGGSIAVTLASAYSVHRIYTWRSERPVLSASQLYAASQSGSPVLENEHAIAEASEVNADDIDLERQTNLSIIRFCICGEGHGSFAYRSAMRAHCDRPTWDWMTELLADNRVLRIGSGTRPTWFTDNWNSVRVRVALKHGDLKVPYPTEPDDVPDVVWADYRHAVHASKHANTQARWKGLP